MGRTGSGIGWFICFKAYPPPPRDLCQWTPYEKAGIFMYLHQNQFETICGKLAPPHWMVLCGFHGLAVVGMVGRVGWVVGCYRLTPYKLLTVVSAWVYFRIFIVPWSQLTVGGSAVKQMNKFYKNKKWQVLLFSRLGPCIAYRVSIHTSREENGGRVTLLLSNWT